jgi:hypothetical protein
MACRELGDLGWRGAGFDQLRSQSIQSTTNLVPLAIKCGEEFFLLCDPRENLVCQG